MKSSRWRIVCALLACGAGWLNGRDAAAQSLGGGAPSAGATSMGSPLLPAAVPLFAPSIPNVASDPTAPATGSSTSGGIMNSPFAAPFLYNSMLQASQPYPPASSSTTSNSTSPTMMGRSGMGVSTSQLGLLMLATQNNGGIGSGRMSGARPGSPSSTTARTPAASKRRSTARPGGLAARYFNRVGGHTPYPQSYYNRQSRYFP